MRPGRGAGTFVLARFPPPRWGGCFCVRVIRWFSLRRGFRGFARPPANFRDASGVEKRVLQIFSMSPAAKGWKRFHPFACLLFSVRTQGVLTVRTGAASFACLLFSVRTQAAQCAGARKKTFACLLFFRANARDSNVAIPLQPFSRALSQASATNLIRRSNLELAFLPCFFQASATSNAKSLSHLNMPAHRQ